MRIASRLLAAMAMLAMACADDSPPNPESVLGPAATPGAEAERPSGVAVLTRNMYVGTDVDAVIGALQTPDPADDLHALLAAITTLRRTDFPSRAAAFAGEIARARPHVVGLQEVSQVDLVLPPLGVDVHLDFLPTLLAELSARGLDYVVAAEIRNIVAQPIPGVSLVADKPNKSTTRFRDRIEVMCALTRPRVTDNGGIYALGDAEWFWQLDDVTERYANKQRVRGGLGYRHSSKWRFEGLLIWDRSRNTIDQPFDTSDVVVDLTVKRVW